MEEKMLPGRPGSALESGQHLSPSSTAILRRWPIGDFFNLKQRVVTAGSPHYHAHWKSEIFHVRHSVCSHLFHMVIIIIIALGFRALLDNLIYAKRFAFALCFQVVMISFQICQRRTGSQLVEFGGETLEERLPAYPRPGWEGWESVRCWMEPGSLTIVTPQNSKSPERANGPGWWGSGEV